MDEPRATAKTEEEARYELDRIAWNLPRAPRDSERIARTTTSDELEAPEPAAPELEPAE
jgi:hypothetical protein